jgi:chromosome partitioning protein
MSASDRLLILFSADCSSKRAVRAVLALLYGMTRVKGAEQSEFFLNSQPFRMSTSKIYCYVGNRLTQMNLGTASAFKTVVNEIGKEIWSVWQNNPTHFAIHPNGQLPSQVGGRFSQNVPGRNQRCEYGVCCLGRPRHPNIKTPSGAARVGWAAQSRQRFSA